MINELTNYTFGVLKYGPNPPLNTSEKKAKKKITKMKTIFV